ncbi:MAG: carboxymuconolactone decarboxylase family protein [Sphingomonadales bacterium]|nr:carboxymuconolactone decarboxylase family protein [Sphingomonadales bacterium]
MPEDLKADLKPRIGNLPREEWTDAAREVFAYWGEPGAWENGSKTNMSMVLANHPPLANAYHTFGRHLLLASTIQVRPRELIVLRTAWLQKCAYEWHYHVGYALKAGLTMAEIGAIRDGWQSPVWDGKDEDRAVLRAVDELIETSRMSDKAYDGLSAHFGKQQMMDLVFTIGNYVMLGWAVATFGIPVEDGVDPIGFDLKRRSGQDPDASHRPFEND